MKEIRLTVCFFLIFLLFFGCSQENANSDDMQSGTIGAIDPLLLEFSGLTDSEKNFVVVVFGYGYNEGLDKDLLLSQLDEVYGLAENGGMIIPFVYPDDFILYGYERVTLLLENIENVQMELMGKSDLSTISTLITLGAPEGMHSALADVQDTGYDIKVFSVFSQDDVLGTEAGSTLVIDYSITESEQQEGYETLGEIDLSYPDDVFDVIRPLINASLNWDEISETGLLIPALRSEYSKKTTCDFFVYVDPQTGLRAENHYVLTQKE